LDYTFVIIGNAEKNKERGIEVNKNMLSKGALIVFTLFLIAALLFLLYLSENSNSYSEPSEALLAVEDDLVLIQAYKLDDDSLYFFINDQENLGASFIHKGLFGWKAEHLDWSPFDTNVKHNQLSGYHGYGDNLIYGLIKNGDELIVKKNEDVARIINLEMLPRNIVEDYHLQDMYLWYIKSERVFEEGEIELINKYSEEVIDVVAR